jgi:hypothetical protein
MAFVLDQNPWYRWPVGFDIPIDGKWKRESFDGHFARVGQDRVNTLVEAAQRRVALLQRGETDPDVDGMTEIAIADEILVGWDGIVDGDGQEVPFSEAMKARLLKVEGVATAIITAWAESLQGSKKRTSGKPPSFG